MKGLRKKLRDPRLAVWLLIALAAVSVAMACCGAERSLAWMRQPVAQGVTALLAAASFLACVWTWRRPAAWLFHAGFALVLGGWLYQAWTGPEDGYLQLHNGRAGAVADDFVFHLDRFEIDRWPDTGTVRQYTSYGRVEGEERVIAVNRPLVKNGWWVYQSSYQEMRHPHTGEPFYFTILMCVKDVGLPAVMLGGLFILLGALWYAAERAGLGGAWRRLHGPVKATGPVYAARLPVWLYGVTFLLLVAMLVHRGCSTGHPPMQNLYEFLMCAAVALPGLTFLSAKRDRQNTLLTDAFLLALVMIPVGFVMDGDVKRLMPALQSPLFVPHVGSYVLGYVLLVRAALGAGRRLAGVGFFLLTTGLVLGAAWGKICWGHWWQFDPKEMWSLATWCVYAAYFHVRTRLSTRGERLFLLAGAAMIVLTLTWINLSRIFTGMHSYA